MVCGTTDRTSGVRTSWESTGSGGWDADIAIFGAPNVPTRSIIAEPQWDLARAGGRFSGTDVRALRRAGQLRLALRIDTDALLARTCRAGIRVRWIVTPPIRGACIGGAGVLIIAIRCCPTVCHARRGLRIAHSVEPTGCGAAVLVGHLDTQIPQARLGGARVPVIGTIRRRTTGSGWNALAVGRNVSGITTHSLAINPVRQTLEARPCAFGAVTGIRRAGETSYIP